MKWLLLIPLLLVGCGSNVVSNQSITVSALNAPIKIVLIGGCEYIVVENGMRMANNYSFAITHKGNCTAAWHRVSQIILERESRTPSVLGDGWTNINVQVQYGQITNILSNGRHPIMEVPRPYTK